MSKIQVITDGNFVESVNMELSAGDTLIVATALKMYADNTETNEVNRKEAEKLRHDIILAIGGKIK